MRVLVTEHLGYIGTILTPMLVHGGTRSGGSRQRSLRSVHIFARR
jgi:hypothetical protein